MSNFEIIRLVSFASLLLLFAIFEMLFQRKNRVDSKVKRWGENFLILFTGNLFARSISFLAPMAISLYAQNSDTGIFNIFSMPSVLEIILSLLFLDLIIYFQHFSFHAFPALWRLHMVHHADLDLDVTTALRFHPVEIIISMFIKTVAVYMLGISIFSLLLFEIILNGAAMFNHSNFKIPFVVDKIIRCAIVTPDMHRVHHSVIIRETNSNFGFSLSIWDRIFKTYIAQPANGHDKMIIGLSHIRKPALSKVFYSFAMPFIYEGGKYPFTKHGSYIMKNRKKT